MFAFVIPSVKLYFILIQMIYSVIHSFYASLAGFKSIIRLLSMFDAFPMMKLTSVSLDFNSLILMRLLITVLTSCCISIAASHALVKLNVSTPRTDLTILLDSCLSN